MFALKKLCEQVRITTDELIKFLMRFMLRKFLALVYRQTLVANTDTIITCKRGSAKHSQHCVDDHTFLWKHAIFRCLPSRNHSTDQYEILHDVFV